MHSDYIAPLKILSKYSIKVLIHEQNLIHDITAGVVVYLVALPLCLGIALASGAPLLSGIIAGIIGGLVVGLISESNISVSGPAAGLSAIVLSAITQIGFHLNYFY